MAWKRFARHRGWQNDIFEDHDGIVDDQTTAAARAAQCHQVETLIGPFSRQ